MSRLWLFRRSNRFGWLFAAAALAVALVSATASAGGGPGYVEHHGSGGETDVNACSYDVASEAAHCDARVRTDAAAKDKPARNGGSPNAGIGNNGAYDPSYLQSAYDVASAAAANAGGVGQIVAIVDAYDDPNVSADLAYYRSFFGLPACPAGTVSPAAAGCVFEKVNQSGASSPYPSPDSGWATEIALDVEMVSAICPACQILLVEANSNYLDDLGSAVNEAVALGANVVSNSYGGGEYSSEQADGAAYYAHPGVAVVASSGDSGYGVEFPAASPAVTAVGGTSLTQLTNGGTRNGSESAWSGAGAGCSRYEPKPSWQHDTGCANRAVADVSAVADPSTGVWVYDTFGGSGWGILGGTSVAAPIVASFYALAGNLRNTSDTLSSYPYGSAAALYDVTSGSDANNCSPAYLCTAGVGYDGPTGLGTPGGNPNSIAAFSSAAASAGPTISSFAPSAGPPGTTVAITGSGLTGATSVSFNGTSASSFAVGSDSSITAIVPAGATSGPITVTTPTATATSPSNFTVAPTSPAPPTGLTATAGNGQVSLSWTAPTTGTPPITYSVYRGTAAGKESASPIATGLTSTAYVDTGRVNGTTYYYKVKAANSAGTSGYSAEASATPTAPPTMPGAPTRLTATARGRGIVLGWTAPTSNGGSRPSSYTVYRGTSSGGEALYTTLTCTSSTCSYTDANTNRGTTYYYQVEAVNAAGTGPLSNEAHTRSQ